MKITRVITEEEYILIFDLISEGHTYKEVYSAIGMAKTQWFANLKSNKQLQNILVNAKDAYSEKLKHQIPISLMKLLKGFDAKSLKQKQVLNRKTWKVETLKETALIQYGPNPAVTIFLAKLFLEDSESLDDKNLHIALSKLTEKERKIADKIGDDLVFGGFDELEIDE